MMDRDAEVKRINEIWQRSLDNMEDKDLENRFTYHLPKEGQPAKYERLRAEALRLAYTINDLCPDSREKSLSLTHLDEVVWYANAAIARHE